MAYTIEQFIELNLARENAEACQCKVSELSCSDCYYNELSRLIDAHPVGLPVVKRLA